MDTHTPSLIAAVLALVAATAGWLAREQSRKQRPSSKLAADGVQEVTILVHNGYHPGTVRVWAGRPVRLVFQRDEDDPCSSRVYLAEPPLSRDLPPFAATAIVFTPNLVGHHLFTCEEGRHRGHVIVERPAPWQRHGGGSAGARTSLGRKLRPARALPPCSPSVLNPADDSPNGSEECSE